MLPENWNALNVFLSCTTQLRYRGERVAGLEYPSVEAVIRIYGYDARDTFERVRIMELAMLRTLSEKH